MLRRAAKLKQIPSCANIEMAQLPSTNGTVRWLTNEQLTEFLKLLPPWVQDLALFGAHTGLRASNVRELKWEWSIRELHYRAGRIHYLQTQETYTVPISDVASRDHRAQSRQELQVCLCTSGRRMPLRSRPSVRYGLRRGMLLVCLS